jgi:hypothetical protein
MQKTLFPICAAALLTFFLHGCGAGASASKPAPPAPLPASASAARGDLAQGTPLRVSSLDPAGVLAQIKQFDYFGDRLISLAGYPTCGIDIYDLKYNTVGAADEAATASGAIMVPTGSDPACSGKRSVVLFAHGNTLRRNATMASLSINNPLRGAAITAAAFYAAQGFIVVAPNYVGYDTSSLSYHPHHVADQQAKDMIDALTAARKAFPSMQGAPAENGKLFLTGFSEGGYASMATHRAMQSAGMQLTASSPQGGGYAESYAFEKLLAPGAQIDFPVAAAHEDKLHYIMKFSSWQKAYGDLYTTSAQLFSSAYASGIEQLVPSTVSISKLAADGKLPPYVFGDDLPGVVAGPNIGPAAQALFNTSYLMAVQADIKAHPCPVGSPDAPLDCTPSHPIRKAWLRNDLRNWVPQRPMLICAGAKDPMVNFASSKLIHDYFIRHGASSGSVTLLDLEAPSVAADQYANAKAEFHRIQREITMAGGDALSASNYHGFAAFLGCAAAGRDFFIRF